jgi:competence protein ComEC
MRSRVRWAVATLASGAAFLGLPAAALSTGSGLELVFLDVGQGDAILIRTPANRWVLVDAGERGKGWDAGERRVVPYLRARGVERLEAMVLTHPHGDHVGGAPAVLRALPVARVVEPGLAYPNPFYLEALREAETRRVAWSSARGGRLLRLDGVTLELLWPRPGVLDGVDDANKISAVIQVRYGRFSVLLTGDAGTGEEREMVREHGATLRSQVLKAGHHGSRTSTSDALLDAAEPRLVVISDGVGNEYGHPHREVLDRLARRGIEVARTDREGTIVVRVAPGGAEWERQEP